MSGSWRNQVKQLQVWKRGCVGVIKTTVFSTSTLSVNRQCSLMHTDTWNLCNEGFPFPSQVSPTAETLTSITLPTHSVGSMSALCLHLWSSAGFVSSWDPLCTTKWHLNKMRYRKRLTDYGKFSLIKNSSVSSRSILKNEENESSDLLLHPVTEHLKCNSGSLQFGEIWVNSCKTKNRLFVFSAHG